MGNQDIKRKIIETTKTLMKNNVNVTIKDIADASFINIAAVNYHFGSKENLLLTVMGEVVDTMKTDVITLINDKKQEETTESFLERIITYVYNYALDNIGVLNYLFLTKDSQSQTSSALISTFFNENDFTKAVYDNLKVTLQTENKKALLARYMMLFSVFSIPLFIQLSEVNMKSKTPLETFKDPEFRDLYIKQLVKMVESK